MRNYVAVNYENVSAALRWAKINCPNYITNSYDLKSKCVKFYFMSYAVDELLMFQLKFGV